MDRNFEVKILYNGQEYSSKGGISAGLKHLKDNQLDAICFMSAVHAAKKCASEVFDYKEPKEYFVNLKIQEFDDDDSVYIRMNITHLSEQTRMEVYTKAHNGYGFSELELGQIHTGTWKYDIKDPIIYSDSMKD